MLCLGVCCDPQQGVTHHTINGRRYRLADYVPSGVVDMSVSVEDINDFMVSEPRLLGPRQLRCISNAALHRCADARMFGC